MIAQKLRDGQIAVGNNSSRKDAVEVIEDLKVSEFYKLVKCTRNWTSQINDRRDVMYAQAPDGSKLKKVFDEIYSRRILFKEKLYDLKKEEELTPLDIRPSREVKRYLTNVDGTARLILIKAKNTIVMLKRKSHSDKYNKENSVCISNDLREEFFKDSKKLRKIVGGNFEIRKSDCEETFNKWSNLITNIYQEGLKNVDNKS